MDREIVLCEDGALFIGKDTAHEKIGVVAGKDETARSVVEIAGDIEGNVVGGCQLPAIAERRQGQRQVMCGEQLGIGVGGETTGSRDGDIAGTAGIGDGADLRVGEIGGAGKIERQAAEDEIAARQVGR